MNKQKDFLDVVRKAYPKAERIYLSAFQDSEGAWRNALWPFYQVYTWYPNARTTEMNLQTMFGKEMAVTWPMLSYFYKYGVKRISLQIEGNGQKLADNADYGLSEMGFYFQGNTPQERNGIIDQAADNWIEYTQNKKNKQKDR